MKIREIKIIAIILGIFSILFKCFKIGQDNEKLKQFKRDEKIIKKRRNIKRIANNDELSRKLRKGKF